MSDPGPLVDLARLACHGVTGCDAAGVTVRRTGGPTTLAASHADARAVDQVQYDLDDGPCLRSLRRGEVVEVADYATDDRWPAVSRAARSAGLASSLSMPLQDEAGCFGALNMYGREVGCFDAESHRVAEVLVRQASQAIRYLELLHSEREQHRVEQRIGRALQRGLLPTVPELEGVTCATRYRVAGRSTQVGGDWFDVFSLPDGALGVAVGDVMGHDIAAAAAMGQLRSVLRSYAYEGISPSAVLDRLDRLVQGFDMAQLATAVYGRLILDRDGAMLVFCNAGHLPPVLRLPDGTTTLLEGAASPLIGAPLPTPVPRTEAGVLLPSGSTLLLYTDGLVERRGAHLDEGLERLRSVVAGTSTGTALEELCDGVLEQVLEEPPDDDVALLAVRIS